MRESAEHDLKPAVDKRPPPPTVSDSAPETTTWEEPPPRRSGSSGLVVAIAASLIALALGYLAYEQWRARMGTVALLATSSDELKKLKETHARDAVSLEKQQQQLASQTQRIEQDASELSDIKAKLGAADARLRELEAQSEAQNEHLAEFRALTKQFQRMVDSGKLQIAFRRGRMIVELPAAVLFASGSAELSNEGRQALQEIAKILRKVPRKRFMVGGHTDDVPIGKNAGAYKNNWALSAARAVTVTESLIDAGMRGDHLVAAGYGEYDPIASNGSERGRQKNRRIEIVLEPELSGVQGALAELKKADAPEKPAK